MLLAIGDVVRDVTDMALGTVVGLVPSRDGGPRVLIHVAGHPVRFADPYDVQLVARHPAPVTRGRRVFGLAVLLVAGLATAVTALFAQAVGAGWLLTLLSGLGALSAVTVAAGWCVRLSAPRRFRV
jgi:hypothetical protein